MSVFRDDFPNSPTPKLEHQLFLSFWLLPWDYQAWVPLLAQLSVSSEVSWLPTMTKWKYPYLPANTRTPNNNKRVNSIIAQTVANFLRKGTYRIYIFTCKGFVLTYKTGSGLDGWIYCHLMDTTRVYRQYSATANLHTSQFTVAHALEFSVSISRILATDL
jgi:hypothetical protein